VYRFLKRRGWKSGLGHQKWALNNTARLREHLRSYLQFMEENQRTHKYREFYLDESYIHENLHYTHQLLVDPDYTPNQVHHRKGFRWCFIAGILGPDYNLSEAERKEQPEAQAQYFPGSLDILPKTAEEEGRSQPVPSDFHAVFNSKFFEDWFRTTAEHLHRRGIKAVFIMDNASYHLRRGLAYMDFKRGNEARHPRVQGGAVQPRQGRGRYS